MRVETYRNLETWAEIAAEERESIEDVFDLIRLAFERAKEAMNGRPNN